MRKITRRVAVPVVGLILAGGATLAVAPSASASTMQADSGIPPVLSNAGAGTSYLTGQLQEHLDSPYLGLEPAVASPLMYVTGHVIPVVENTLSLILTGQKAVADDMG